MEHLLTQITQDLGRLEGKVDAINERLDKLNGKVAKHEDDIANFKYTKGYLSGAAKVIWVIVGAIGSLVVILLPYFLKAITK